MELWRMNGVIMGLALLRNLATGAAAFHLPLTPTMHLSRHFTRALIAPFAAIAVWILSAQGVLRGVIFYAS